MKSVCVFCGSATGANPAYAAAARELGRALAECAELIVADIQTLRSFAAVAELK